MKDDNNPHKKVDAFLNGLRQPSSCKKLVIDEEFERSAIRHSSIFSSHDIFPTNFTHKLLSEEEAIKACLKHIKEDGEDNSTDDDLLSEDEAIEVCLKYAK